MYRQDTQIDRLLERLAILCFNIGSAALHPAPFLYPVPHCLVISIIFSLGACLLSSFALVREKFDIEGGWYTGL
jgi:hypothetical protein